MATSIRDLVQTLEDEARYRAGTSRRAGDAAGALEQLGRALGQVAFDGLELDRSGAREAITRDLADSCAAPAVLAGRDRHGRLTVLAGGLADTVGVLSQETGRDHRWAIAVELANTARVISTYAAEGDGRRLADLAWIHLTARALVAHGVRDAPTAQSQAVLDRAIPRALVPPDMPAAQAAREALAVISDRLRRAAAGLARTPTLLEVLAVSRAAQSTTRYGAVVSTALAGRPAPDTLRVAAIWHEVRERLQPFAKAAASPIGDRGLGPWAQRAHSGLHHEFGPAIRLRLTGNEAPGTGNLHAIGHLQAMVNEIPPIADHLATTLQQLADTGDLHALAPKLPFREYRLTEFLEQKAVLADRFDLATVIDRLDDAAELAAELAVDLDRVTGNAITRQQPGLLTAHAARVGAQLTDSHAALLLNDRSEEMANDTEAGICHPPQWGDDELDSSPAWDVDQ